MTSGAIVQLSAKHNFNADAKTFLLKTGFDPGKPTHVGQVALFGIVACVGQEQKSFVCVFSSQCTSSPIIVSIKMNLFLEI